MKLIFFIILFSLSLFSQTEKLQEEKELEAVNFQSIKKILMQDGLSEAAKKKEKELGILKEEQAKIETQRYFYPRESELWGFLSDYWVVKNAQLLNWDFEKPDYGLESSFRSLMEQIGFYQKKFKILLVDTPSLVRASLPGDDEFTLIISVPFIRQLDLSRLEISLLLFEDYVRLEQGYFKKNVMTEKMSKLVGTNFEGTKPDVQMLEEILKNYNSQIMKTGYNFQQMFEVTKKMDAYLKSSPEIWNSYFRLLSKIDRFIKSNNQFNDYLKLYPSPEMQVKWLSPEEKVL
jgi:hypothetical protein